MQVTSTGIAVALAVVIAGALLFFGTGILSPFAPHTSMPVAQLATTTDMTASTTMDTNNESQGIPAAGPAAAAAAIPNPLPTQLTARDEVVGTGTEAAAGDQVTVNYVGMLPDGTVFDASAKHGQPFTFTLGAGQVIKGWDLGVAGMKVGGKRQLIIPPSYGYGNQAVGGVIPANSTLIFEVELVNVQKGK